LLSSFKKGTHWKMHIASNQAAAENGREEDIIESTDAYRVNAAAVK
jgi:hypothetical protein